MQSLPGGDGTPLYITILDPSLGVTVDYWVGPSAPFYSGATPPSPPGYFWVPLPMQSDYAQFGANYSTWIWYDSTTLQLQYGLTITVTASGDQISYDGTYYWFYYATL